MTKKENDNNFKIPIKIVKKLNKQYLDKSDLIGIICFMLYSKDIFHKNRDIVPFLKEVFSISYLQYIINSRTLIVARITKYIYGMNDDEFLNIQNKILKYFKIEEEPLKSKNKKKNANEKLEIWLKRL